MLYIFEIEIDLSLIWFIEVDIVYFKRVRIFSKIYGIVYCCKFKLVCEMIKVK